MSCRQADFWGTKGWLWFDRSLGIDTDREDPVNPITTLVIGRWGAYTLETP